MTLDMDKLNKLPQKYKLALLGLLVVLIFVAYGSAIFMGKQQELATANTQLETLQIELTEKRTLVADLPRFKAELVRLEAELGEALRKLPNGKELPVLLTDITTLGKNAGLEFKSFIPGAEINQDFYAEVPISIELIGGFHELATFFDELSRLDRIVNMEDFSVDNVEVSSSMIELTISGIATTFRFISEAEAAAAAEETPEA